MAIRSARGRGAPRTVWSALVALILIVLVFAGIRVVVDVPNVVAGRVPPPGSFHDRYAMHPALAYAHILPGLVYLVGAPFQLSRRFRTRHLDLHRRMGRVVLAAGIAAAVFAIVFGILFPFGGALEASATVVFGGYFAVALVTALLAVTRGDLTRHRRWMIRAFAVGLGVGSIRIWIGVFQALGVLSFPQGFGVAFWLGFVTHALAAEIYLTRRPGVGGARSSRAVPGGSAVHQ